MDDLTVVDLFAGAGGLSLGFQRAGFRNLWAADNQPAATETFKRNIHHLVECVEIEATTEFPRPTVIVGGPPCQGFSSAGMRESGDVRNTLVSVFAQVVRSNSTGSIRFRECRGHPDLGRGWATFGTSRSRDCARLPGPLAQGQRGELRSALSIRKRVLAIGGLGFDPMFPDPTRSAFGAPGATLATTRLPATATVAEALSNLPRPGEVAPRCPQDHHSSRMDEVRQTRIAALKPGQTMRDLPEEYWHPSFRRRAYRRVKDGTPSERRGGPPFGMRRLKGNEPSKAITGRAANEFVPPLGG